MTTVIFNYLGQQSQSFQEGKKAYGLQVIDPCILPNSSALPSTFFQQLPKIGHL
jgi:hypothetical protein